MSNVGASKDTSNNSLSSHDNLKKKNRNFTKNSRLFIEMPLLPKIFTQPTVKLPKTGQSLYSTEQRPMISRMEVMIIKIEKQQKTMVIARRTARDKKIGLVGLGI